MEDIKLTCRKQDSECKPGKFVISAENDINNTMLYKFLIGKDGRWKTLREFSEDSTTVWYPEGNGDYFIMVQIKKDKSRKSFDYTEKMSYTITDSIETTQENNVQVSLSNEYDECCNISKKDDLKVVIDREFYDVGEKVFVKVITYEENLIFKYWMKQNNNWMVLKDNCLDDSLAFTITEEGVHKLRVEAKHIDSINEFDYENEIDFNVKKVKPLKITDFQCVSSDLLVDEELIFQVNSDYEKKRMILYKFIKINKNGKLHCIQDYSTKKILSIKEKYSGKYKLLCLAKDLYSLNEYDDRAIFHYKVKPYKTIKIENFITDVCSPQACGCDILLKAFASGGNKLLYRYIVKGNINEDSGFIRDTTYKWTSKESGNYLIELRVKDISSKDKYEASKFINFIIDNNKVDTVKIEDIIFDKKENIKVNDKIFVEVIISGGFDPRYSFVLLHDGKEIEKINYEINNWVNFVPKQKGNYTLEVKVRDRYSNREYDSHSITHFNVDDYTSAKIDYILISDHENYIVGDKIPIEIISKETQDTKIKYKLFINNHIVEESEYSTIKKYEFNCMCSGKYHFEFYAKNIDSDSEYDCKKKMDVIVNEAIPVTNTRIMCDRNSFKRGVPVTIKAEAEGGKGVIFEFYLMENGDWNLVQKYSKKNYYTFIPFKSDIYKILVLCKSTYNKKAYEDFSVFEFIAENDEKIVY